MTNDEFRTEAPALLMQWKKDTTALAAERLCTPGDLDILCLGWCISKGMSLQQAMNFRVKTIIGA